MAHLFDPAGKPVVHEHIIIRAEVRRPPIDVGQTQPADPTPDPSVVKFDPVNSKRRPAVRKKPVGRPRVPLKDRLLAKCKRAANGCLEWQGSLNPKGYGKIARGGNVADFGMEYVHIAAYEEFVGPVPAGMEVCHSCDNRRCCEHTHLFVATHDKNMEDIVAKRWRTGGERSRRAKLKAPFDAAMRELVASGELHRIVVACYRVHRSKAIRATRARVAALAPKREGSSS